MDFIACELHLNKTAKNLCHFLLVWFTTARMNSCPLQQSSGLAAFASMAPSPARAFFSSQARPVPHAKRAGTSSALCSRPSSYPLHAAGVKGYLGVAHFPFFKRPQ